VSGYRLSAILSMNQVKGGGGGANLFSHKIDFEFRRIDCISEELIVSRDVQVLSILALSHDLGVFYGRWRLSQSGLGAEALIIYIANASGALGPPVRKSL
jgi:hypothetical protein